MLLYQADQLRRVGLAIFRAAGASDENASRVTEALIDANLTGHDSHGVLRIPQYLDSIRAGEILPAAKPVVMREAATSAMVDGGWAFGQVGAALATRVATAKAKEAGIAAVGLVRVHHIGRLGEYASMAAEEGVVAMVFAGGFGGTIGAAPYGGAGIAFSTNPLSFGFPAGERPDVMSDYATTAVAAGKIRVAKAKGEQLPPGCIADKEGRPSTNPDDFYNGGYLLPFGGHKGYALGVVVELLGQALTGADAWAEGNRGGDIYGRSGALVIALDPAIFRPRQEYAKTVDSTIDRIKRVPPAPGFAEVLLPGEPELRTREQRAAQGIPVAESTWQEIRAYAEEYGLDADNLLG
jgi:hydroxycarboxylate dehydrogenase B